jgi:ferritin-like protein
MQHVNDSRSTWVSEYYYLVDRYRIDGRPLWENLEEYLAAMTQVVNGAACVLPPIMDFVTDNRAPIVRLPERFAKF